MQGVITVLIAIILVAVTIIGARAAVLTQDNSSRTVFNLTSYEQGPVNFTVWLDVPANSSFGDSRIGSLTGFSAECVVVEDGHVDNFTNFWNYNSEGTSLQVKHTNDGSMQRSYVKFDCPIDADQYDSVLLRLPYAAPDQINQYFGFGWNLSAHEVYDTDSWNASTITWNNQPCGKAIVPDGAFCNETAVAVSQMFLWQANNYSCANSSVLLNITPVVKRTGGRFSLLLRSNRSDNPSISQYDHLSFCSEETGVGVAKDAFVPTSPSLWFGGFQNPKNVSFYWNDTFSNATLSGLNYTVSYNQSLNSTWASNLSIDRLISPIPLIVQLWGPGTLQLDRLSFQYAPEGRSIVLSWNDTSDYVVALDTGSAVVGKTFGINNSGTLDAFDCNLSYTVLGGSDLAPYLSFDPFNISNSSFVNVSTFVVNAPDGAYTGNLNAVCEHPDEPFPFTTTSPIKFVFSISTPQASGGGGGGSIIVNNVVNVTNESVRLTPRLIDLLILRFPTEAGLWEQKAFSNVALQSCIGTEGFSCSVNEDGSSITLRKEIPYRHGVADTVTGRVSVVSPAGAVQHLPVRVRVIYASLWTGLMSVAAAAGLVMLFRKTTGG